MNVYDCFMYFDEELLAKIRLNILNKYVSKFLIVEAKYTHNGDKKKLNFNFKKFTKFKNKIEYIIVDKIPPNLKKIKINEDEDIKAQKLIFNGYARDIYQRNQISKGLVGVDDDDVIIISDLDEVPNLTQVKLNEINNYILVFKQKIFYYKLNLLYRNFYWFGSKACKKKILKSPQWLREIKAKKYSLLRLDTYFSKKKYSNLKFVDNGGWHFTYIKSPREIFFKLSNFAHHYEFERSKLKIEDIKKFVLQKRVIYDYDVDKRNYKWSGSKKLVKYPIKKLPNFIYKEKHNLRKWID